MVHARRAVPGGAIALLAAAALAAAARLALAPAPAPPRPAAAAGTFVSGAVGWELPYGWTVQAVLADRACEGLAVYIPCPPLDATPHSANANLLAEPNVDGVDLAAWTRRRLAVAAPRRVVEERLEGAWRTVVSTGEDRGARYVVVERFGVSPRARVHAVAAFPELPEMGEAWFARTGAEIDRFLDGLSLAGAPPSGVHVGWDEGDLRLAAVR
ncbi:MAG TPA: hypothetical protein VFL83_05470 [Anaeromyxobacter sp.]|nr:hypothetical protein [Anaeromyxobacter sp.]